MKAPRSLIAAAAVLLTTPAVAEAVPAGGTALVDRPTGFGALPFDGSKDTFLGRHAVSADGCKVVFTSSSDSLLATDENGAENVYRQDRCAPGAPIVQVNTSAEPGSYAFGATISADGRRVAFISSATNLHPDAHGAEHYVYVKDLDTGRLDLASRGNGATGAPVGLPERAIISGDGRSVVFLANGPVDGLGADGVDGVVSAYLRSLVFETTRMVSVKPNGDRGGVLDARDAPLDVDHSGSNVAFVSEDPLTSGDTDDDADVYSRRAIGTLGQTTVLVGGGSEAAISGDGNLIAYSDGRIFAGTCAGGACDPATLVAAGDDNRRPFFPQTGSAAPTRVLWSTDEPLEATDTNKRTDVYTRPLAGNQPISSVTGGVADEDVEGASVTDDLAVVLFSVRPANLPGADGRHVQAYERVSGTVRNLAPLPRSEAGDGDLSPLHAVSDDGRVVAFVSDAPALGAPFVANTQERAVFARDVVTGVTTQVSVGPDGSPANWSAINPSIDAAGRRIVFQSAATNLGGAPDPGSTHVYLRDLHSGTTTPVDGVKSGAFSPQISGDGTKVVFESYASGVKHVYRRDLVTGAIEQVDRSSGGASGDRDASYADLSYDGNRVAFQSNATNLGGPADAKTEVYVRDLAAATTTWVSEPESPPAERPSASAPSLSGDGNRVAFQVEGAGFGRGAVDYDERVFVRDLAAGTTTPASPAAQELAEDVYPALSRDGRKVVFTRFSARPGRLLIRDLASGAVAGAGQGRFGAHVASLNGDGSCVAFESASDDLVAPSPGPDFDHVYLHALGADCPAVSSASAADTLAPVIRRARVTRKRFALARGKTARNARAKRGTAFTFRVSEAARTRITIRRKRGKAVVLRRSTARGANRVAFSGRVGRVALRPGTHRAALVATDAAGNRSKTVYVRFRVVR